MGEPGAAASSPDIDLEGLRRELARVRFAASKDRGLLEAILRESPHGIIVADATGALIHHNPAAERIWGGSAPALSMDEWSSYRAFHPDGRPFEGTDWPMARCLLRREIVEPQEFHIQRFDGTFGDLVGSCAPIVADGGELLGALSVFADVTKLKESERARRALEAEMRDRMRELDAALRDASALYAFASALSTIRTPDEVAAVMAESGRDTLGASATLVCLVDRLTQRTRVAATHGLPDVRALGEREPLATAMGKRELVCLEDRAAMERDAPGSIFVRLPPEQVKSVIAMPLFAGPDLLGGVAFGFVQPQRRLPDHFDLLLALAGHCAQALERAYAFEGEVVARLHAEQLAETLSRRSAQLSLSAAVGEAFTRARDAREMLQRCAQSILELLGGALVRIWTVSEREPVLELQASAGLYTHIDGPHGRIRIGELKIGLIAREGKPHLTNNIQADARIGDRDWAKREGLVAFAGYPLFIEGRIIGVVAMFARTALYDDTLAAFASVADALAMGIERHRALRRLREETDALDTLNRIGQVLAAELDTERLVQAVIDTATRLAGAELGAFAPTFVGEGIVRVDDVRTDPRYAHNEPLYGMPAGRPISSYLAVPVVSRSRSVLGGLFLGHARPGVFTERAERLVAGVAAQAAVAMDNAELFGSARRLIEALERSNAELDQFAHIASHDLKAPLRGIHSLTEWLEEDLGALGGETRKHLDLMRTRVRRMEALIEGILTYARAGRTAEAIETIDVDRLIRDALEMLAPPAPALVEIGDKLPVLVTARVPLQQVLMNLISNGLRHAGRPDARVTVTCVDLGPWVEFRITDNGPGIVEEHHERIWNIFQTLASRDRIDSAGIGLAIVRKIVVGRGGRAWVESKPGEGASFRFTWPKNEQRQQ